MPGKAKICVPLSALVNAKDNIYEITNAAIRRSQQLAITDTSNESEVTGKIVSRALTEILTHQVDYKYER